MRDVGMRWLMEMEMKMKTVMGVMGDRREGQHGEDEDDEVSLFQKKNEKRLKLKGNEKEKVPLSEAQSKQSIWKETRQNFFLWYSTVQRSHRFWSKMMVCSL